MWEDRKIENSQLGVSGVAQKECCFLPTWVQNPLCDKFALSEPIVVLEMLTWP
jgi:hypothetical protein